MNIYFKRAIAAVICLLVLSSGSAGAGEKTPDLRASSSLFSTDLTPEQLKTPWGPLVKEGDMHFVKGRFDKALSLYKKALSVNRQIDIIWMRTGDIHLRAGRYELSGKAFERALRINPRNTLALVGLADIRMEDDDLTEAEKLLKKALAINPRLAVALTTMGDIYLDRGDLKKSEEYFKKSLESMPNQPFPDTYIGLGELHLKRADYSAALENFRLARKMDPFDADVYLGAFRAQRAMGRKKEAEEELKLCMERIPLHLEGGVMLIEFYMGTGRKKQAGELLDLMLKKYPKDPDLLHLEKRL